MLHEHGHGNWHIHASGPSRFRPEIKLVAVGLFLAGMALAPPTIGGFAGAAVIVFIAVIESRLPWKWLFIRIACFLPLVVLMSLGALLSRGVSAGLNPLLAIVARSTLSFIALMVLIGTTPTDSILKGLRRLRVPRLIVALLGLTARYFFVLEEELGTMQRARRARTFHASRWAEIRTQSHLIGALFLRALDRAERVHQAMLARGWTGEVNSLD